jgi:Holliday junction resolvasome RuvABC endonuclease subunit
MLHGGMMKTLACISVRLCVAAMLLNGVVIPPAAKADPIGDLSGILANPFKLGQASSGILESVERIQQMLSQVGSIEATTNADLANRISQVKGVVDDVITAVDQNVATLSQVISQAETQMAALERAIYIDAQNLLNQVQCVAHNITTIDVQEAIANAVASFQASGATVKILGVGVINLKLKTVQIIDPDQAYISVRDGYLKQLAAIGPADSAYKIISIYSNIERVALDASCAYTDPTLLAKFHTEEFKYSTLSQPWNKMNVSIR